MKPLAKNVVFFHYLARVAVALAVVAIAFTGSVPAQDVGTATADTLSAADVKRPYSPYAGGAVPNRVFWGDTHLHTSYSMDAGAFGNRLDPEAAYRFARGEEVESSAGGPARLARPLDFLVVADHSDNMGFFPDLFAGSPTILADPTGKEWYQKVQDGRGMEVALAIIDSFSRGTFPEAIMYWPDSKMYRSTWEKTIAAAEKYNEPGHFTAFIGYEWTSQVPPGQNLHRVVIYRDDADKARQTVPATTYAPQGSTDPEYLWKLCRLYEDKTGGDVLAIAHNGNLSNGLMFPEINPVTKKPFTEEYAETRAKWEPLYEVTQIKGDGEAHPFLSPNDEFADYGTWDKGNLNLSEGKKDEMLQYEYARSALQLGLKLEKTLGTNPFKFGMIGSTDSHTSLATADDDNFFGKHSGSEPGPRAHGAPLRQVRRQSDLRLGDAGLRLRGRLGTREHPRGALRRHGETRDLRDYRATHAGPILRWMGLRGCRRQYPPTGGGRLPQGRADGRRSPQCSHRQVSELPACCSQRSDWRQPRPRAGGQGLGRRTWRTSGEDLRRRGLWGAPDWRGRPM